MCCEGTGCLVVVLLYIFDCFFASELLDTECPEFLRPSYIVGCFSSSELLKQAPAFIHLGDDSAILCIPEQVPVI